MDTALHTMIRHRIAHNGGWLPFDDFMHLALYTPGLGYYAHGSRKIGRMPQDGSDFATAPEISPLFGQTLAVQVQDALHHTATHTVWEFGAGSGALCEQVLDTLLATGTQPVQQYTIVEVSAHLRARQQQRLARFGALVQWADTLPAHMHGVILGNEVLDAMPVKLLARIAGVWHERGIALDTHGQYIWQDRPTTLHPPVDIDNSSIPPDATAPDYITEIHPQAEAFIRTLGQHLQRGAIFLLDYGFGEREYYHPQRHMGTLMCHHQHRADTDPLSHIGNKDITAHVNFTAVALAAQAAGLDILGYTTQGWFLLNCGMAQRMQTSPLPQRAAAQTLVLEHEMGELFKVIGLSKATPPWPAVGFTQGDRSRQL